MGIMLERAFVTAEGDVDFRGTLGVARDVPVGFSEIRLLFELEAPAAADKLPKLVELSERYCVVLQTLSHAAKIVVHTQGAP